MRKDFLHRCNATASYALLQIMCWGFYAVSLCFSSNVLYGCGFTDSHISMLLGVCTGLSFVMQLWLAERIASHPKIRVWGILGVLGVVMALSNLLVLIPGVPKIGAAVSFGVVCMLLQTLPSWTNAVGMAAIKRGSAANYSIARGFGSLGYSILAYFTGILVARRGASMVAGVGTVCGLVLAAAAVWFHFAGERGLPEEMPAVRPDGQKGSFLRQYPLFALFLAGSVALQFSHNLLSNFMYQIMLSKQGGAGEQGVASAICALVELPVMFGFPLLMRRLRCDKWVRFASMFVAVKAVGILLAGSPYGVYAAQATQMLGYGLYTISSVNYAELVVGRGESVRAQTYLGATSTVGTLLATSTGGFLCQYLGVQAMVMVSLAAALTGGLVILFTAEKTRR